MSNNNNMITTIGQGPQLYGNSRSNGDAVMRSVLRRAWNTKQAQSEIDGYRRKVTPFRAVKNAGDYLCRQNAHCGGPNQSVAYAPGRSRLIRAMSDVCDQSMYSVPVSSANQKYVYNSSDYTRFLKEKAINSTYHDNTRR